MNEQTEQDLNKEADRIANRLKGINPYWWKWELLDCQPELARLVYEILYRPD